MEIFFDSVSVINMNFDTLTRVNYSRQSRQLYDATVGVNRAQLTTTSLEGKEISSDIKAVSSYSFFGDQDSHGAHIRNIFL